MFRIMKKDVCKINRSSIFPGKVMGFDDNLKFFGLIREKFQNCFFFQTDEKFRKYLES